MDKRLYLLAYAWAFGVLVSLMWSSYMSTQFTATASALRLSAALIVFKLTLASALASVGIWKVENLPLWLVFCAVYSFLGWSMLVSAYPVYGSGSYRDFGWHLTVLVVTAAAVYTHYRAVVTGIDLSALLRAPYVSLGITVLGIGHVVRVTLGHSASPATLALLLSMTLAGLLATVGIYQHTVSSSAS